MEIDTSNLTDEQISKLGEYVEKMKDKPRKQIRHPGYKPTLYWHLDPEDLPWFAGGATIVILCILVFLGVV